MHVLHVHVDLVGLTHNVRRLAYCFAWVFGVVLSVCGGTEAARAHCRGNPLYYGTSHALVGHLVDAMCLTLCVCYPELEPISLASSL